MTSILTNNSAMAALSTLRSISSSMEDTQSRISSGLRVGSASDNAAYWSIATTMRSDNQALSAVQDALGLGAAKVDTAYSGMEAAIEVVKEIKAKLVAASEDGVDKNKIQEEISQLQEQLTSIAEAASFSGENWLQADLSGGNITKSVVGSFVRDASGNVSVKKVNYDLSASSVLFDTAGDTGILDATTTIEGNGVSVDVNIGG
ncbi:flagellin N-terminal helical domain-containing protein, partial [Sinorhizobium meliloti]